MLNEGLTNTHVHEQMCGLNIVPYHLSIRKKKGEEEEEEENTIETIMFVVHFERGYSPWRQSTFLFFFFKLETLALAPDQQEIA